jgi:thiol-disulfide isomerase/thioredoxin
MMSMRIAAFMAAISIAVPDAVCAASHGLGSGLTVTYKSPVAPPLRLETLQGGKLDLSEMKGRVVVINFWATWCPPCIEEMPSIQRLWQDTRDAGLQVLAVNVGEPTERIRAFLREFEPKLEFPVLLDPDGEAFQTWGVRGLPKTFIVNKQGRIYYEAEGGRDMSSKHIRARLQILLDE